MRARVVVAVIFSALAVAWFARSESEAAIAGLWTRYPDARDVGDPVRFYFFHEKGYGLYRYGKIGLNNTNSFDWKVNGDELVLTFRKTGEVARTTFSLANKQLVLARDPREPLAKDPVAYTFVPAPFASDDASVADLSPHKVGGRLWMDKQKFATGGEGFLLYQLKDAAIDGRGVGWHHIGDFDDWSTEALSYRVQGDTFELAFPIRRESARTRFMEDRSRSPATLQLLEDPRGYWHVHTYLDAGPSFGSFIVP